MKSLTPRLRLKTVPIWILSAAMVASAAAPVTVAGQTLAQRVSSVGDGTVRMTYDARPDVMICDQGVRMGDSRMMWHSRGWDDEPENCRAGFVEVEVRVQDRSIRDVDLILRLRDREEDVLDLGRVEAQAAADFLLEAARNGGRDGRGEEEALLPALLADVEDLWKDLLELARDRSVESDVRSASLFWVGQEAADVVSQGLTEVALDEEEEQEVREAAVFALSQRPPDEGVPALMQVARSAREPDTRRSAMFWLAQSEDERVFAFFEEILVGGGGG